jgi:hypothetical protein
MTLDIAYKRTICVTALSGQRPTWLRSLPRLFSSIKFLLFSASLIREVAVARSQVLDAAAESVTLKQGLLRGSSRVVNGHQLFTFFGVPYAEPPVGNRRLRPTAPHPGWKVPDQDPTWIYIICVWSLIFCMKSYRRIMETVSIQNLICRLCTQFKTLW